MSEQVEVKSDTLPDLDDLLQCPVCYEIPSGQIFQCNEGHHVCGRCKTRLDVCPVCRALFFGTRNYAMEELIANVRKLRAFKLGGKVTTDSCSENNTPNKETGTSEVTSTEIVTVDESGSDVQSNQSTRAPQACKGLFRCLSCKTGNGVRLPAARLLNHLRYFHSSDLIEGKSENGEYLQAWQICTVLGRIVIAVRVADMGIFFLIIELSSDCICAWLSMAASPWVAHEFSYTLTLSGNDREAIFSDCVWSVRSCEGSLKKRGHCLTVNGTDARALIAPATINGKLSVRRTPLDQLAHQTQPRAVLRVANRINNNRVNSNRANVNRVLTNHVNNNRDSLRTPSGHDLEPFLQDLQNDVARLSRAFASLGRDASALARTEAEMRERVENRHNSVRNERNNSTSTDGENTPTIQNNDDQASAERVHLSRNARRRMRQRVRAAINGAQPPPVPPPRPVNHIPNLSPSDELLQQIVHMVMQPSPAEQAGAAPPVVAPQSSSGPSNGIPQNENVRVNKKRRRQRR